MAEKTQPLQVRLSKKENEAFKRLAEQKGETRSSIVRKMIREMINGEIDLLTDEASLLKIAIRQLIGISNNLNQLTVAIHSGKTRRTIDEPYLESLKTYIADVKESFRQCVLKTKTRWVKKNT